MPEHMRPPAPVDGEEFYLRAYNDIATTRQASFGNPAPLAWDRIRDYGLHHQLEPDVLDDFIVIIREMDAGYAAWWEKKHPQKAPPPPPSPGAGARSPGYSSGNRGRRR